MVMISLPSAHWHGKGDGVKTQHTAEMLTTRPQGCMWNIDIPERVIKLIPPLAHWQGRNNLHLSKLQGQCYPLCSGQFKEKRSGVLSSGIAICLREESGQVTYPFSMSVSPAVEWV